MSLRDQIEAEAELVDPETFAQAAAELRDALEGDVPDETPDDRDKAERMAWALSHTLDRLAAIDAAHDNAVARLTERRDELARPLIEQRDRLQRHLTLWLGARIAEDPKRPKSEQFMALDLKSKEGQPEWVYEDAGAFLAWAEQARSELVNTPPPPAPRPDKNAVKKALKFDDSAEPGTEVDVVDPATGEVVPGVRVKLPERKFTVVQK